MSGEGEEALFAVRCGGQAAAGHRVAPRAAALRMTETTNGGYGRRFFFVAIDRQNQDGRKCCHGGADAAERAPLFRRLRAEFHSDGATRMVRLSSFIRQNIEPILDEWETFARSLPQGEAMESALRDHAKDMLWSSPTISTTPRRRSSRPDKARGRVRRRARARAHGRPGTWRGSRRERVHGRTDGRGVPRAARERDAPVESHPKYARLGGSGRHDAIQRGDRSGHRGVDHAVYPGIGQSKERFLAILGHDLRTPVGAIVTSTRFMLDTARRIGRSPAALSLADRGRFAQRAPHEPPGGRSSRVRARELRRRHPGATRFDGLGKS